MGRRETKKRMGDLFNDVMLEDSADLIAGVDEAGRGPLAGPVVAAAVILDPMRPIAGLKDSKQLTEETREQLAPIIKERALDWSVAHATVEEIDELNILQATMLAMKRAVAGLTVRPNLVLVDGNRVPHLDIAVNAVVGGDETVAAISAASIIAKTTRDHWLMDLDRQYPEYGFAKHKGYGTAEHMAAIEKYGPLPVHRKSFGPIKKLIEMRKAKDGELELT
jgi:ribonuclease HII